MSARAFNEALQRFVNLDHLASAAHRGEPAGPHGLTNAMRKEPCRLVSDLQDAVQLMRRAALFRAAKQVDGLQHLMERNAAMLENGPHLDRKLLTAFPLVALPQPETGLAFAVAFPAAELGCPTDGPAMRANRAVRPQGPFEVLECRRFVVEGAFCDYGHGQSPMEISLLHIGVVCKRYNLPKAGPSATLDCEGSAWPFSFSH
jgi:hypothetical protein